MIMASKVLKKMLSVTAAAALTTTAFSFFSANNNTVYAESSYGLTGLNAWEITDKMTIGWNLGNTLESTYWADDPTPAQSATAWGNPEPTQELFEEVRSLGFNTVRIPVTWYQHMEYNDSTQTYEIDSEWMDYVKKTVDYAYDLDMFVIINVHHEDWINVDYFNDSNLSKAQTILEDVWEQIADEFADYDQHLIFEGLNEPRQTYSSSAEWGNGDSNSWGYVDALNSTFVSTVRSSSSSNNSERLLMIPSYHATDNYEALSNLTIPSSSGNIAVSVHAYEPYSFTMDNSEGHKYQAYNQYGGYIPDTLTDVMNDLKSIQSLKNVPIIIGEFGASDFNNTSERVLWAQDYITQATEAGFVCVLWDNNVDSDYTSGDSFGYIDRSTNKPYSNAENVLSALISGAKQGNNSSSSSSDSSSDKVTLYGSSAYLSAWECLVFSDTPEYISSDYRIAVEYSGDSSPMLVLENKYSYSWDICLSPNEVSSGTAYYDYSEIESAFSEYGVSIFDMGKMIVFVSDATTISGVYAVPASSSTSSDNSSSASGDPEKDYSWKELYGSEGAACLSAWSALTISDGLDHISDSYKIAVVYSGDSAPMLVLENKYSYSWDICISASEVSSGAAFYSYDDIVQAFSNYGVSIYDMGQLHIFTSDYTEIYGVYAAPV